jgi:hypothetical protein
MTELNLTLKSQPSSSQKYDWINPDNEVIPLTRGEGWDHIVRFNPGILLTRWEGWNLIVRFNLVILLRAKPDIEIPTLL